MAKKKVTVTATVEVSFHPYPTVRENRQAQKDIAKWIKDTLFQQWIPLYVQEDEGGAVIEDAAGPTKVRVQSAME